MFNPLCQWGDKKPASGKLLLKADKSGYKGSGCKLGSALPFEKFWILHGIILET